MTYSCYLSLGSNISPQLNIRGAVESLESLFLIKNISSEYSSQAVGLSGDDFVNVVVEIDTALPIPNIKTELNNLEKRSGRNERMRGFQSRTLDIDLITYGASIDPQQRIPHPDLYYYSFVLTPILEINSGFIDPLTGLLMNTYAETLLKRIPLRRII